MEGIHLDPIRRSATFECTWPTTAVESRLDRFERGGTTSLAPAPTEITSSLDEETTPLDRRLVELGFEPHTGTILQLPCVNAVAAARECGDELAVHTRIYGDHLREKVLLSVRAYAADYLRGRDDSLTAARLERSRSLTSVAELLEATGQLEGAIRFATRKVEEPLRRALARVGDVDSLSALDRVEVAIVDLNGSGTIDERDILAVEIGGSSVIGPVGRELADRLRLSACVVRGMDDMVDSWTGESRLNFTSGAFQGPTTWFRLERDHFALRQERVPDKPWLTRAKSASQALRHVRDNADEYTMDCAAAISVAWFLGKYHEIGELAGDRQDAVFDEVTPHLTIGMWHVHWSNVLGQRSVEVDPRTDVPFPGESRYFKATDISPRGRLAGWQGENVLFYGIAAEAGPGYRKGERIWFGHPFGLTGEREIISTLNANSFDLDPEGLPTLQAVMASGSPATTRLASALAELDSQVTEYVAVRNEYDQFMRRNRRVLQGARDRTWLLQSQRRTDTPEYLEVQAEYQRLNGAMQDLDSRSKSAATHAAATVRSLRQRVENDALIEALDQLMAAPSALHDVGRMLLPYRAFQDKGNNAVKLV